MKVKNNGKENILESDKVQEKFLGVHLYVVHLYQNEKL